MSNFGILLKIDEAPMFYSSQLLIGEMDFDRIKSIISKLWQQSRHLWSKWTKWNMSLYFGIVLKSVAKKCWHYLRHPYVLHLLISKLPSEIPDVSYLSCSQWQCKLDVKQHVSSSSITITNTCSLDTTTKWWEEDEDEKDAYIKELCTWPKARSTLLVIK